MLTRGRTVYGLERSEKIAYPAAVGNLLFLLFGRIPDKVLGVGLLAVGSFALVGFYSSQTAHLGTSLSRFEAINLPNFVKTNLSAGSEKLRAEEAAGSLQQPTSQVAYAAAALSTDYTLPTDISYTQKIRMFATSYDKNCPGCNGTTASGLPTGYGVVAVDPKVIPLGTKLFIPGYGAAIAGDTGGAVKGAKIDLGFDNIKTGWWSSRFVDVYILQ